MIRSLLLSTVAGLGLAASGGAPARAACVADATGFVCNGLDLDGVRDERAGILGRFQTGSRVVRDEYVPGGPTPPAVVVGDRATLVLAEGAEVVDDTGAGVVTAGRGLTLINDGIVGGRYIGSPLNALVAGDDLRVVNGDTGRIGAETVAIRAGDHATIVNEGWISALVDTVTLGDDALFVNAQGAFLFGQEDLVTAGANLQLRNAGTIESPHAGIFAGAGLDLENTGAIRSGTGVSGGAGSQVDNRGVIASDFYGVSLGAGSQVFNNGEGARIAGDEWAVSGTDGLEVGNTGLIEAEEIAIRGLGRAYVSNGFGGVIRSRGTAVRLEGSVEVDNQGLIQSEGVALEGSEVTLRQGAGSQVVAGDDAIRAGRVGVESYGLIRSERGDGIDAEQAYVQTYRGLEAPNGVAIRLRGTTAAAFGPANTIISEQSSIVGRTGIEVARGRADTLINADSGTIRGTAGTAMRLANGADRVLIDGALVQGDILLGGGDDDLFASLRTRIEGRTLLGAGQDRLILRRSMFEEVTASFGIFDGGAGFDTVNFRGFSLADLSFRGVGRSFLFDLVNGDTRFSATFERFERFRFDDGTLRLEGQGGIPAPVPLPAALPLLAVGLLGLGWIGRRRAG